MKKDEARDLCCCWCIVGAWMIFVLIIIFGG